MRTKIVFNTHFLRDKPYFPLLSILTILSNLSFIFQELERLLLKHVFSLVYFESMHSLNLRPPPPLPILPFLPSPTHLIPFEYSRQSLLSTHHVFFTFNLFFSRILCHKITWTLSAGYIFHSSTREQQENSVTFSPLFRFSHHLHSSLLSTSLC